MARKRPPVLSSLSFILCVFGAGQLSAQSRWIEVPLPTQDTTLFRISFVDSTHGWVAGRSGVILATTDGGNTWRKDSIAAAFPIWDIRFVSATVGWALAASRSVPGYERRLYKSTDAGVSWNEKTLPDTMYLMSVSFTSDSLVRIGALDGHLWATTDGGDSWHVRSIFIGSGVQPASLDFYDELQGYVGGGWGPPFPLYFQTTTDGGYTWTDLWGSNDDGDVILRLLNGRLGTFHFYCCTEGLPQRWLALTWNRAVAGFIIYNNSYAYRWGWATDSLHCWLLESLGFIRRTSDSGATWEEDTLVVPIAELLCDTYGHRFALGRGRLFYFDTTSTSVDERKTLPTHFGLCQNYPNPFNPSTQINFDLPVAGAVSLTIYDVLGRKVAELANGYREAGYHSVTWNAGARLASGVYLARFAVANEEGRQLYAKSMKLMLMK